MITTEKIINIAKSWVGTPFHAQGRLKNVGCDCAGLIIGICNELGIVSKFDEKPLAQHDIKGYRYVRDSRFLDSEFSKHLYWNDFVSLSNLYVGNILLLKFNSTHYHIGIISKLDYENNAAELIHACSKNEKVLEHSVYYNFLKFGHKIFNLI